MPLRGRARLELRIGVDGARDLEQRLAPAGGSRDRAAGRRGRGARLQAARATRPRSGSSPGARASISSRIARSESRVNGTSWQRERIVSGSGPRSSATRTMTAYGGGSSRSLSSASAASSFIVSARVDEVDAAVGLERPHVQVAAQLADVVDADLVADRLDEVDVGMRAALDAAAVPDQLAGERDRGGALADAGRAVEEVRVRRALVGERGAQQPLRLGLLRKCSRRCPRISSCSSSGGRVPSSEDDRSAYFPATMRYAVGYALPELRAPRARCGRGSCRAFR